MLGGVRVSVVPSLGMAHTMSTRRGEGAARPHCSGAAVLVQLQARIGIADLTKRHLGAVKNMATGYKDFEIVVPPGNYQGAPVKKGSRPSENTVGLLEISRSPRQKRAQKSISGLPTI